MKKVVPFLVRLVLGAIVVGCAACATWKPRPMSPATKLEIERSLADMRAAADPVSFAPTAQK